MLRQFPEISSWRKNDITIKPHEVYTLNFRDTLPNIFVINNPNLANLKIGISAIPRPDSYEFRVEYNTTETIGRPIGTNNLYILNDSSVAVKIVVFSDKQNFDPAILKNMNVSLEGYVIESATEISGFKEGLKLPVQMEGDVEQSIRITGDKSTAIAEHLQNLLSNKELGNQTNLFEIADILTKILAKDTVLNAESVTVSGTNLSTVYEYFETLIGKTVPTDLSTVYAHLETLIGKTVPTDLSAISNALSRVESILSDLIICENNKHHNKGAIYQNKVSSFQYTATKEGVLHFGWLFNDGEECEIKKNGNTVLSVMSGEQFADLEIEVSSGDIIKFESSKPSYRLKYWLY